MKQINDRIKSNSVSKTISIGDVTQANNMRRTAASFAPDKNKKLGGSDKSEGLNSGEEDISSREIAKIGTKELEA